MTGMKMALATDQDMEVAYELCGLLDNLSRGYYPGADGDENAPAFFDEDDIEHLQALHKRIEKIAESSGSIHRVVGGFSCMRNPTNELIDLTQDVVEFHPSIVAGREAVEKLAQIRASIAAYYEKQDDDTGRRVAADSTEVQLVDDLLVLLNNMDVLAVSAGADAERAIDRARLAESRLESATQPLDEQMARLNQRVIELNAENILLRTQTAKPEHSPLPRTTPANVALSGAALDTLVALVERGPLDDGDVPSKSGRNELLSLGLAAKVVLAGKDGYQAATYAGRDAYSQHFGNADTMREATAFRKAGNAITSAKHRGSL